MTSDRRRKKIFYNIKTFLSWQRVGSVVVSIFLAAILFPIIIHFWIASDYKDRKFEDIEDVQEEKVAIVFGAGLWDGEPSPVLAERVRVSVELYKLGKVERIIMSGDNRTVDHDEPSAMVEMAKEQGVPGVVLQPDYAGRRTYDTCYRAKHIFKLSSAILVTQDFHMDRALYLCNSLGVDSVGVIVETKGYKTKVGDKIRDYFALVKAVWEVNVDRPDNVVLGETIRI